MTVKVEIEGPIVPAKKRKLSRPTTPDLEALYFRVCTQLTKRETALFMYCLGRSPDDAEALVAQFKADAPAGNLTPGTPFSRQP